MTDVARPSAPTKRAPRGGRQPRRASPPRAARSPSIADTAEPQPQPQQEAHPPLYWRRWAFLASALFSALFVIFAFCGVQFSYARPNPGSAPGIVTWSIRLLFWGIVVLALLANLLVAGGWFPARYHTWLHLAMAGIFPWAFLGVGETVKSLVSGVGYSEPMTWLLVVVFQVLTILSAHEVDPPGRWHPSLRVQAPQRLVPLTQRLLRRWRIAIRAFHAAWQIDE